MTPARDPARRNLVLVCVAMGVSFVAQTLLMLAVPLHAVRLGASPAVVGLLVSAAFAAPTVFAIPMGRLVARLGVRRMMAFGALGMAVGPLAVWVLPGLGGLAFMQFVVGTSQLAMGLAAQATIAASGRGPALERAFGWYTTIAALGQMLGPLLGGALLEASGPSAAYGAAAALPLASLASALALFVPRGTRSPTGRGRLGYAAQVALLRANVAVQASLLLTIAVLGAFVLHAAFFAVYLEGMAIGAAAIGLLVSLRSLAAMLVRPFTAWAIARLGGRPRAMLVLVAAMAAALTATGVVSGLVALGVAAVVLGVATGLGQPLTLVILSEHVEPGERPSALGLRLTVNQGTQLLAPMALGVVAQAIGYGAAFVVAGLAMAALAAGMVRVAAAMARAGS